MVVLPAAQLAAQREVQLAELEELAVVVRAAAAVGAAV